MLDDPEFHSLVDDLSLGGDLIDVIRRYREVPRPGRPGPARPFVLKDIIDKRGNRQGSPLPPIARREARVAAFHRGEAG